MKVGDTLYCKDDLVTPHGLLLFEKGNRYEIIELETFGTDCERAITMKRNNNTDNGFTHFAYDEYCKFFSFYVWKYFKDIDRIRKIVKERIR